MMLQPIRQFRTVMVFLFLLTLLFAHTGYAQSLENTEYVLEPGEVNDAAADLVAALPSLGAVVNKLADVDELAEPIPFTDVNPSEALNLDTLFTDALGVLGAPSNLSELGTILDALDNPNLGGTGIAVQFNNVVADDAANTLSFEFVATRALEAPIKFAHDDVSLDGSSIALTLQLTAPFDFGYDGSAAMANEKVFLSDEPTIAFTASADVSTVGVFESKLGFTSVAVDGSLALNVAIDAAFTDPDMNGRLTVDEWSSTAVGDLIGVQFADGAGDDINASLNLDASIVPGSPDATVIWMDADLTDGPGAPMVTLNSLEDFTNIDENAVYQGIAKATTALMAAQNRGDLPLPLLTESLSDVFDFADPLVQFVHELGDAAIICGTNNTSPPSGSVFGLEDGDTVYCQAYTINPVDQVDWKIDGTSSNTDLETVGSNPSTTAQLVLGDGGMESLTLDFRFDGETDVRVARPLFLTAEELAAQLVSVAGIDTVTPEYDPDLRILTYRLEHTFPTVSEVVETNFGDQLKADTGIFGLSQSGSDQIIVDVSSAGLDVTFGVILVDDPADITSDGTDADRFFLQVTDGNEFEATVNVAAGSNFFLEGSLAFLGITATGVETAGNPGGSIFALSTPGDNSLAVNINAAGIPVASLPNPIPDAILVSDLFSGGLESNINAVCELGLSCGLEVKAEVGDGELASGKVAISWPSVFEAGGCTPDVTSLSVTPDGQFNTDLLSFNIDPDNPQKMLSIILDAIAGFTQGIDALPAIGDLDVRIPIVGVSPRELLDKLEDINDAINKARMEPAATLQALELQLETELGLAPNDLMLEVADLIAGGEKELILRLGYSANETINKPLNFQLDDDGLGLVSASNGGNIVFGYDAGVQFEVAIPLKPDISLDDTRILETSRASAGGQLDLDPLSFNAAVGPLEIGATGVAKLDVAVDVANPATNPLPLADWLSGLDVVLTGESQDCGSEGTNALTGQACARLALDLGGPVGTLGFRAEDITAPDSLSDYAGWFVSIPGDLSTAILDNVLDFDFLFKVLPELASKLRALLEQGSEDISVPGLGEALDAGADVVAVLEEEVINPLSDLGSAIVGTNALEIENQIRAEVLALGPIVLDRTGDGMVNDADVDVVARCGGGAECADDAPVLSIEDVQVTFQIGQQVSRSPDFDIGLDGLPVQVAGAMSATADWKLLLSVGLSKTEGPYIFANNPEPELQLSASVQLGENTNPDMCDADLSTDFPDGFANDFTSDRCLEGKLAFLSVGMYDGKDAGQTNISLDTTLDLESTASSGRLTAGNIINGVGLKPGVHAASNIDLAMRTSIDLGDGTIDGLPAVVGAFHVDWAFDTKAADRGVPTVTFDHLYLDVGTFASQILEPIVKEVRKVTSPLEPIVDFIRSDVPILTQLAEIVGEEPVTVLTLIQLSGGFDEDDLDLVDSVLQLISLANSLPTDAPGTFIDLGEVGVGDPGGSFELIGERLLAGPTTPDQAQTLIAPGFDAGSNLAGQLPGNKGVPLNSTRPGTFGVEGLTFPFLDHATDIFGLLLGQDVTVVRMDFGTFEAGVSEGYEFGPIFIGPFPVTAEVGLAFSGEARFAMGYDTRGLRLVLDGGDATKLFNGIFIDDLDDMGRDVDEWKLTFRVSAEASLDVLIAEAGVYGGVDSTLSGNLDDNPDLDGDGVRDGTPDGKLYIDEIVDRLSNPICLFIIKGKLDIFFGLFAEVDLFLWSDRWEWEIFRATLLDFTTGCEGEDPDLGEVDGNGDLWLNIGDRANQRGIQESVKDEEFTVRQVGPGKVSIEAFGIKQERSGITGVIRANAADGDDVIALVKGADANNDPIAFTIGSVLNGGSGNDSLTGGDGVDIFTGGPGDDKLIGGKGDDILSGDGDNDRIDGGIGMDTLNGGNGNDTLTGGPGADTMNGDDGNDSLLGGPYTDEFPDGADTISGGNGNDNIDGGPGDDFLYGDESGLDCLADGAVGGGADAILGGAGSDTIVGGFENDRLFGNEDNDKLCGNAGNDYLDGDDDDSSTADAGDRDDSGSGGFAGGLFGGSGNDVMYGRGGDDEMFGGADNDEMYGGADNDSMQGDDDDDHMYGEAGDDVMNGNAGQDTMYGGDNADTMYGDENDDHMFGDDGTDMMYGNAGSDFMRGGADNDTMHGNAGDDEMYGDSGDDHMFGNENNDTMRGNTGDDYMEGNGGSDTMYGDAHQDDMIGGSSTAGELDDGDLMFGNAGQDVMIGDNGTIERPGGASTVDGTINRRVTRLDIDCAGGTGGMDTMRGNDGNDDMWGGCADDTMHGDQGDDYMEGNNADDNMFGDQGQDDLIGGSGRIVSDDDATAIDGRADGADEIHGGSEGDTIVACPCGGTCAGDGADLTDDYDVIIGDNGLIDRSVDPLDNTKWVVNSFNGSVAREIRLLDVGIVGSPAAAGSSGGDCIFGAGDYDVLYGQGGNDYMLGGTGDDDMEGNAGHDQLYGNEGNDDMLGGTGPINDDPPTGTNGRLDGADAMHGNDGFDVMAGDNAVLVRTLVAGQWVSNSFNDGIMHEPRILLDIDSPDSAVVSNGDLMFGDEKDDLMYGQGGGDEMHGNDGDDFMEGNADADTMTGDAGQDDMLGGTVQAGVGDKGDDMRGNGADDVMLGDNGTITRPLGTDGQWQTDPNTGGVIRDVALYDVQTVGSSIDARFSGGDLMHGNSGNDHMFGQGGNDEMHGGDQFDYIEGNHDDDLVFGDGGEDDLIGGGSAADGVISPSSIGDGLLDGEDEMHGGDEGDVMTGDNARLNRLLDTNGLWVVDPNPVDVIREVALFDVETVGGTAIDPDTSGSDRMYGDAGRDLMFGQGNTRTDDDSDGHFNEDPWDGVDNDRDGREGPGSLVYDCGDQIDNDGDGLVDDSDPGCMNFIDEDGGGDEMHGGTGVDYMEGNHGSDWMFGDEDEDDMLGGNSAGDGVIGGDVPPTDLLDGDDVMSGGDEDDVMTGDNARILRLVDDGGIWLRHQGGPFDLAQRDVIIDPTPEAAGAFGNDHMRGNSGDDDMYGQLGNDFMEGNNGEDAMIGDIGKITNRVEDGSREEVIVTPPPFFEDTIFPNGSMTRQAALYAFMTGDGAEGDDLMLGGDSRDSMHGCAGNDMMNGDGDSIAGEDPVPETDDEDHMFGGDGDDVMWGGRSHDHVWGGHGDDHLDVRPRTASVVTAPDTPEWFTYGEPDNFQDLDIIYGGWGADALQANVAIPGPPEADRLLDWAGGYNVFYVCPGAYGEGTITRAGSPHLRAFLQDLAESDGALSPHTPDTSGFREVAYVFPSERGQNSHPPHPDHPGHFICDDGTFMVGDAVWTMVDLRAFASFQSCFVTAGLTPEEAGCAVFDFDGSGQIDSIDTEVFIGLVGLYTPLIP